MMSAKNILRLTAAVTLLLALAGLTRADVVTYTDGRVVKGIIEDLPGDPSVVMMTTEIGRITIPKARIASQQKESRAAGLMHIGEALMLKAKYQEAIARFQQAVQLEPANAEAARLKADAEAKLAAQQHNARTEQLGTIDQYAAQVHALMEQKEFAKAEALLKQANKLIPSDEQKLKLRTLMGDMYLAWADERADKLDQLGVEKYLNLSLAANPRNEQVIERMLKIWEKDPQKRKYTVQIYETILERHPDDRTLELNLANMYYEMKDPENAVRHYMHLLSGNQRLTDPLAAQHMLDSLERLHRQSAQKKQFDVAIKYFDLLATLAPEKANYSERLYYQYYQKGQGIQPNDFKSMLGLADFAEKNGLDHEALNLYRTLGKAPVPEIQAASKAALTRYALKALNNAEFQFNQGNYTVAKTLADTIQKEFPDVESIQEKLANLIGKATIEETREQRSKRDQAKATLDRANEFYNTGYMHYQNMFSTQRRSIPVLGSDRTMAIRYFTYAIQAYNEAMRIDPTLANDPAAAVKVKLGQARDILTRLNEPLPLINGLGD